MPAADHSSPDGLTTRLAAVLTHLSRVALDLHLLRLPPDAPHRIRLDRAIAAIDRTIRECQILALGTYRAGRTAPADGQCRTRPRVDVIDAVHTAAGRRRLPEPP